jgi:hypothetical protein
VALSAYSDLRSEHVWGPSPDEPTEGTGQRTALPDAACFARTRGATGSITIRNSCGAGPYPRYGGSNSGICLEHGGR